MTRHTHLLTERNLADWVTLLITGPFLFALYFIMQNEAELALLMGLVAFALDSLDGVIARKLAVASDFGRQLDSAFDILIYLVFPTLFSLRFLNPYTPISLAMGAVTIVAGILRLIRFNIIGYVYRGESRCYPGLGVAYLLLPIYLIYIIARFTTSSLAWLTPFSLLIMSFFMISNIPIQKPDLKVWFPFAFIIAALILAFYFKWL